MSGRTYGVWRCPVCGTTKNQNESSIRNPLNRYNHLRWHEKMHPGTVRRKSVMDENSQSYCGYVVIGTTKPVNPPLLT